MNNYNKYYTDAITRKDSICIGFDDIDEISFKQAFTSML